ncbi:titin-like isoform X11 [Elysia marginata]|uniref:Titin-like isoform X11 n=1 Tax=Elysia marginata TaxID=1093978 RepID=A0AAV4GHF7_9GAST|nr:titin-like isoform X11 [Elysia marginata]
MLSIGLGPLAQKELPQAKAKLEDEAEKVGEGKLEDRTGVELGVCETKDLLEGSEQLASSRTEKPVVTALAQEEAPTAEHATVGGAVEREVVVAEAESVCEFSSQAVETAVVFEETVAFEVPVQQKEDATAQVSTVEEEKAGDFSPLKEERSDDDTEGNQDIKQIPEVESGRYTESEAQDAVVPSAGAIEDQGNERLATEASEVLKHSVETYQQRGETFPESSETDKEDTDISTIQVTETTEGYAETSFNESRTAPSDLDYSESTKDEVPEEESPLTAPKYTSLADPITKELVREKIETIEEVVTQMEHRYDTSVESRSFSQHVITEQSNEGMFSAEKEEEEEDIFYRQESRTSVVTEDASEPTTQDFSEIRSEMVESTGSQSDFGKIDEVDARQEELGTFEDGWGKTSVEGETVISAGDETIGKEEASDRIPVQVEGDRNEAEYQLQDAENKTAFIISTEFEGEGEDDKTEDGDYKNETQLNLEILRSRMFEKTKDEEMDSMAGTTGSDIGKDEEVDQEDYMSEEKDTSGGVESDVAAHDAKLNEAEDSGPVVQVGKQSDAEEVERQSQPAVDGIVVSIKIEEVESKVVRTPSDEEDEYSEDKQVVEKSMVTTKSEEVESQAVVIPSDEEDKDKPKVEETMVSTKTEEVESQAVAIPSDEEDEDIPVVEETMVPTKTEEVESQAVAIPSDEEDEGIPVVEETVISTKTEEVESQAVAISSDEEDKDIPVIEEKMVPTKTEEVESQAVAIPSDEEDEYSEDKQVVEKSMVPTKSEEVESQAVAIPSDEEDEDKPVVEEAMVPTKTEEVESQAVAIPSDKEDEDIPVLEETVISTKTEEVESQAVAVPSDEEDEDIPVVEETVISTKTEEVESQALAIPSDEEDEDIPVVEETVITAKTEEVESQAVAIPSDEEDEDIPVVEETVISTKTEEVESQAVAIPSDEEDEDIPVVLEETVISTKTEEVESQAVAIPSDEEDEDKPAVEETVVSTKTKESMQGVLVEPSDDVHEEEDQQLVEENMVFTKADEVEKGFETVPSDEENEADEESVLKAELLKGDGVDNVETQPQTLSGYVSEEFSRRDEEPGDQQLVESAACAGEEEEGKEAEEEDREDDDEELKEFEETERSLQNEEFGSDESIENIEPDIQPSPKIEIEKDISSEEQVEYPEYDTEAYEEKEAVLLEQIQTMQDFKQSHEALGDVEGDADYHYETIERDTACHGRKKVLVETRMGSIEIEEIEPEVTEDWRPKDDSADSRFQDIVERSEESEEFHAEQVKEVVAELGAISLKEVETREETSFSQVSITSKTSHEVVTTVTRDVYRPEEQQEEPTTETETILLEAMPDVPSKSPHISSEEDEEDQTDQVQPSQIQDEEDDDEDDDEEVYSTSMKILGSTPDEIDDIEEDEEREEEDGDYDVRDEDIEQEIEEQEQLTAALMSQLSKSDSGGEEEPESSDHEALESAETCLEKIVEHSTESETLTDDQADGRVPLKSDFVRVHIPILEHCLGLQENDSRGTPSTESGSYSMKTEPSLKEVKEDDISEDKSSGVAKEPAPDVDTLFGKINKEKEETEEDVDKAFDKYEKETALVAPIDAKIGEDVLEADEDIDRAFELYDDGKEQPLVVPIDAEIGEDVAEVKEDIDRAFAVYGTESEPPTAEEDVVDSVIETKRPTEEDMDDDVEDLVIPVKVADQQEIPVVDDDEKEEYEVQLSKTIVQEALYTSIEATRRMEERHEEDPVDSDISKRQDVSADSKAVEPEDKKSCPAQKATEEDEKPSTTGSGGIMAELQELEAEQRQIDTVSEDEFEDDDDYGKEDFHDDMYKVTETQQELVQSLEEEVTEDVMTRSIDRTEIIIEEPGPEKLTKSEESQVREFQETDLESQPGLDEDMEPEQEMEPERETSMEHSETIVEQRPQLVSSKDGDVRVVVEVAKDEEDGKADVFPETFIDRREEFIEVISETVDPDGRPRSKVPETMESGQDDSAGSSPGPSYPRIESDDADRDGSGGIYHQGPADGLMMGVGLHLPRSPLHPTSSTEVHDRSGSPSDLEEEIKEMDAKIQHIQMNFDEGSQESQDDEEAYFSPEATSPYNSQSGQSSEDGQRKQRSLFMASSISGSEFTSQSDAEYYTGQSGETTGTSSYFTARSEVMSSSSFTSGPSETMTGSECTLTGSEGGQGDEDDEEEDEETEGFSQRLVIQRSEQTATETLQCQQTTAAVSSSEGERGVVSSSEGERAVMSSTDDERENIDDDGEDDEEYECLPLDRPPSVSDFTLIESMDQDKLNISLGLVSDISARTAIHSSLARSSERLASSDGREEQHQQTLPSPGSLSVPRDSDMEKDSLQGDDEDDGETGDYDKEESDEDQLVSDSDREGKLVAGDVQSDRPPSPSDFTLIASQDQESLNRVLGLDQQQTPESGTAPTMPWEHDLERALTDADAQSTASSDAAMMVGLDHMSTAGTDNNTMSGFSSESGQQEASPLEERDTKQGLYETYLRDMDREFPEASAVAARKETEEDWEEAKGDGELPEEGIVGEVEASTSTLSLSEHVTVVETHVERKVVTSVETRRADEVGDEEEKVVAVAGESGTLESLGEPAKSFGDKSPIETDSDAGPTGEIPPQDRFDFPDGNDDDDDARAAQRANQAMPNLTRQTADLEEGAQGPVLREEGLLEKRYEQQVRVSRSVQEVSYSAGVVVTHKVSEVEKEEMRSSALGLQLADPTIPTWPMEATAEHPVTQDIQSPGGPQLQQQQQVQKKAAVVVEGELDDLKDGGAAVMASGRGRGASESVADADKMSSSSSEVAQFDDFDDQDVEGREVSEETSEETDVEDQFSPVPPEKHGDEQSFSFDTPIDSHPSFRPRPETVPEHEDVATPVEKGGLDGALGFSVSQPQPIQSSQAAQEKALSERPTEQSKFPAETEDTKPSEDSGAIDVLEAENQIVVKDTPEKVISKENDDKAVSKDSEQDKYVEKMSPLALSKSERPKYVKQETRDISPEDLTEKPSAFDFPEQYTMEVKQDFNKEEEYESLEGVGQSLDEPLAEAAGGEAFGTSHESSSDGGDLEIFDETTGEYTKVPWEVAHHYTRQFSEVFKEEQKVPMKHQASLDMGAFYTRDKTKDNEFLEKVFYDEPVSSTSDIPDSKRVSFAPGKEETLVSCRDEEDGPTTQDSSAEDSASREPYERAEETHESSVINIILENRQQVKEVIARKVYDPEFPAATSAQEDSPGIRQTSRQTRSEFDESEEDAMFTFSPRSAEGYELETRSEFFEVRSFSYEGHGVVSRESRMAHQELLMQEEDNEEEDRSLSPSRDSKSKSLSTTFEETLVHKPPLSHPTHFPMAVHSVGKSLADNEIYESSETERDSTEEKLSPIEETPSLDEMEEETLKSTTPTVEKRVTFQTDRLVASRFSEQSVDDFKASSSSSELSVEPTLLAASYDLDSGSVCHVVTAYDISPDTVEKQGPAEITGKAILSSPEDDVFEMDAQAAMAASLANKKLQEGSNLPEESSLAHSLLRGHLLARVDPCSSPTIPDAPVSTPREGASGQDLSQSLWTASSKLERFQDVDSRADSKDGEDSTLHEGESSPLEDRSLAEIKSDAGSPVGEDFVSRSPEETRPACEITRREEQVEETRGVIVLNGPTEVEYIPEYDDDHRSLPSATSRLNQAGSETIHSTREVEEVEAISDVEYSTLPPTTSVENKTEFEKTTIEEVKREPPEVTLEQRIQPTLITSMEAKPEVQQALSEEVEEEFSKMVSEQSIQPTLISSIEAKPEVQQASTEVVESDQPKMVSEQSIQPTLISSMEAKPEVQQASTEVVESDSPEMAKPEVQQASTEVVDDDSPEMVSEQSIQPSLISSMETKPETQEALTEVLEGECQTAVEQSFQLSSTFVVNSRHEVHQVSSDLAERNSSDTVMERSIKSNVTTTKEIKSEFQQTFTERMEQSSQSSFFSTTSGVRETQQATTDILETDGRRNKVLEQMFPPDTPQATDKTELLVGEPLQGFPSEIGRDTIDASQPEGDEIDGSETLRSSSPSLQAKPDIQQPEEKDEDEPDYAGVEDAIVPARVDLVKAKPDIQQPEGDNGKGFPVEEEPIQSATTVSFTQARPEVCQPEGEEIRPQSQVISEGRAPILMVRRHYESGSDDDDDDEVEDEKSEKGQETPEDDKEETKLKWQEEEDENGHEEKTGEIDVSDYLKRRIDIGDDKEVDDEETHPKEEYRPSATVSVTEFEPDMYSIEADVRDHHDIGLTRFEESGEISSTTYVKEVDDQRTYDFRLEEVYHGKKALEPSPTGSLFSETYEDQDEAEEEVAASGGSEPFVESVRQDDPEDIEMGEEEEEEEFEERAEEELIRLEDAVVESEEEQGEEIEGDEEESESPQYGRERSESHTAEPSESLHLLCASSGSQSDLDRPLSPTPDALRQGFFSGTYTPPQSGAFTPPVTGTCTPPISGSYTSPQPSHSQGSTEEPSALEQTAVTFVDSILEDVKVKVSSESSVSSRDTEVIAEATQEADKETDSAKDADLAEGQSGKDVELITEDFSESGSGQKGGVTLVKQISEDIPGIILTQHLHKEVDEDEYYGYSPQPSSISEEDEDRYNMDVEEANKMASDSEQVSEDIDDEGSVEDGAEAEVDLEKEIDQDDDFISETGGQDDDEEEDDREDDEEEEEEGELECIGDEEDEEEEYKSEEASPELPGYRRSAEFNSPQGSSAAIVIQTQKTAITHEFPEDTPSDEEKGLGDKFGSFSPPTEGFSSGSPRGPGSEYMMASNVDLDISLSQSDYGDTSSVDSFATVVVADDHQNEFDENRLAEIASMTSSFTSDMQISFQDEEGEIRNREPEDTEEDLEEGEEDDEEEEEVEVEDMERSQEWVSSTPEDNRESSSSLDSDRYGYVDRAALSIITEMSEHSDEDKLEAVEKEDLESEAGLSDHFGSSPDFNLQCSPGIHGVKGFFKRNGNGENVSSLSSSLAEFERLEQAIPLSSSLSSIDRDPHRDTFGGSYDERKLIGFPKLAEGQESESIASSLAEFEHLEKVLVVSSSGSSVEKQTTSDSKSSGGSRGSNENNSTSVASSLNEFERLERELQAADSDGRKSSVESSARPSEASSLNSLNEFERLEHEMVVASELEAEAQKIVSILESGVLVTSATQFGSSDLSEASGWDGEEGGATKAGALETDSLDGDDDDVEHDSLSEGRKVGRDADVDSLDGESSEMTEMTSSVVYAGPDIETVAAYPEAGGIPGSEFDTDSLQGEAIMQLSSDSLALEQMLKTSDSTKFDTDSLFEIDDRMMRSGDSIGGHSSSGGQPSDKNIMHTSVDSLEIDLNKEDAKEKSQRESNEEDETVGAERQEEEEEGEVSSVLVGAAQEEENLVIEGAPEDDNLLECGAPYEESGNLMMASLESAAWSMGSSGCTTTSRSMSVSHSESSHSHDLMQVSTESDILKGSIAAGSEKKWAAWDLPISEEKQHFHREESSYQSSSVYHVSTTSTVKMSGGGGAAGSGSGSCSGSSSRSSSQRSSPRRGKLRRDSLEEDKQDPFNPFADWGPYRETKKVYTMAEWEEMKRLKRERQEAEERQRAEELAADTRSSQDLAMSTRPDVLERLSYASDTEKHEREVSMSSGLSFSSSEMASSREFSSKERTFSSSSTSSNQSQIRIESSRERTISSSSTSSVQSQILVHSESPPPPVSSSTSSPSPAKCSVSSSSSSTTHSYFSTSATSASHKRVPSRRLVSLNHLGNFFDFR